MANPQTTSGLFPAEAIPGLINEVKGKSTLAKLAASMPVAFTGTDLFTFAMDSEVNLVGENGAHSHGGITVAPVTVKPNKIEYGARVTEEFMTADKEKKLDILAAFNEGFARKLARGIDIIGMHGFNPRSGQTSALVTSYLDKSTKTVNKTTDPEADVQSAIELLGDVDVTGLAMAKAFASDLGKLTNAMGSKKYPDLMWGGQPNAVNGVPASVNSTVDFGSATDLAIVGDFANYLRWGYAQGITFEVIPYGDPDNSGVDLKGHGQVYLRCQCFIGIGILNKDAFARIIP